MKKYFIASLLCLLISIAWAESHFLDMRVGDFGCITRVVFEFTSKVDYSVKEDDNTLTIDLSSLKEGKILPPVEESLNIDSIAVTNSKGSSEITLTFLYPIEVTSYNYFQESKNYIIVLDVYDIGYKTDKKKGLATLLFKGQKFPLNKISSEITTFSNEYSSDALVNLYLGRLFAKKKMKDKAIEYFSKIPEGEEQYFTAQAFIDNLNKNRYPTEEVKPDFLEINQQSETIANEENNDNYPQDVITKEETSSNENMIEETNELTKEKADTTHKESSSNDLLLIVLGLSILVIVIQFIQNIKKKFLIKELEVKLEGSKFELSALANKLEKGVIENSKTKDRIIIKLFNNGWQPQDIANELSTSIEIVEATISKEGRL